MPDFFNDMFGPKKKRKSKESDPGDLGGGMHDLVYRPQFDAPGPADPNDPGDLGNGMHDLVDRPQYGPPKIQLLADSSPRPVGASAPNPFLVPEQNPQPDPNAFVPKPVNPTAQIEDDPEEGKLESTMNSAPARFIRAGIEATPKAIENVATVGGMMVGAPAVAGVGKAGLGWLGGVLAAGQAGGLQAAVQAAGPGLNAAAPLVEGAALGEGALASPPASMGSHVAGSFSAEAEAATARLKTLIGQRNPANEPEMRSLIETIKRTTGASDYRPTVINRTFSGEYTRLENDLKGISDSLADVNPDSLPYMKQDMELRASKLPYNESRLMQSKIDRAFQPQGFSLGGGSAAPGTQVNSGPDPSRLNDVIRNLQSFPGASKITMPDDPSMQMHKALELLKSRQAGAGDTWAMRARSWRTGEPDQEQAILHYLDEANNAARVDRAVGAGQPAPNLPGGIAPSLNSGFLADSKKKLGIDPNDISLMPGPYRGVPKGQIPGTPEHRNRTFYDSLMPKIEEARAEMLNVGKATGQMNGGKGTLGAPLPNGAAGPIGYDEGFEGFKDYVPNVLDMRFQDRNQIQMLADTEAHNRFNLGVPTAGKGGFGSGGAPGIAKTSLAHYEGSKQELEGDAFQRLAWKGAQVERNAMMNQFVDRLKPLEVDTAAPGFRFDPKTMGAYDKGNGEIAVFPRDVALALSEASEQREVGMVQKGLGFFNNIARQGLLKYNPSFQIKQVADDLSVGLLSVPWGKQGEFLKGVKSHMDNLLGEFAKANAGEYSAEIAAYRRRGTMNEIFESLIDTTDEIRHFSDKTLGHATGGLSNWLDEAGQVRETAVKSALADMYEGMGATPERAVSLANQITGDYISRSKTGKELGEFMPMMKWYTNAVKRLTVAAIEDPVTAKRNPLTMTGAELRRAASTSPLSKVLPMAVAASILNGALTGGKHWDADGLIIGGTKIVLPGYGGIIGNADGDKTVKTNMSSLEDRLAAILQTASLMTRGETIGGKRADPFTNPVSSEDRAREMARRGGLGVDNPAHRALDPMSDLEHGAISATDGMNPLSMLGIEHGGNLTPEAQKSIEGFAAPIGMIRRATSADSDHKAWDILKMFSPVQFQDVEKQDRFDFEQSKDALLQRYVNGDDSALDQWLEGGGSPSEFKSKVRNGERQKNIFEMLKPDDRQELREKHRR